MHLVRRLLFNRPHGSRWVICHSRTNPWDRSSRLTREKAEMKAGRSSRSHPPTLSRRGVSNKACHC